MRILLCGMMGCGKTTVGKHLAKRLQKPWADTDDAIVKHHGAIADIFAQFGELLQDLAQNRQYATLRTTVNATVTPHIKHALMLFSPFYKEF